MWGWFNAIPCFRASAKLDILAKGNAEADRLAALRRFDEAWWIRSSALLESYKACPRRDLAAVLKDDPRSHAQWVYRSYMKDMECRSSATR
jgi:hypothetical protein